MVRKGILPGLALLLSLVAAAPAPARIFDHDDRTRPPQDLYFNSFASVVFILIDIRSGPDKRCSGVLIDPTTVLTAGHCVRKPGVWQAIEGDNRIAPGAAIWVYFNALGDEASDRVRVSDVFAPKRTNVFQNDFAVLKLSRPPSTKVRHLFDGDGTRIFPVRAAPKVGDRLFTASFPKGFEKGDGRAVMAWQNNCHIRKIVAAGYILSDCDTTPGMSGGPIFHCADDRATRCEIVGIIGGSIARGHRPMSYAPSRATYAADARRILKFLANGFPSPPPLASATQANDFDPQDRFAAEERAREGNVKAMLALARLYAHGVGVYPDPVKSYYWYTAAVAKGSGPDSATALRQRNELARELSPAQMKRARARVRSLPTTLRSWAGQPAEGGSLYVSVR